MFGNLSTIGKITAATGLISIAGQLLRKQGPLWDIFQGLKDSSAGDKANQLWDMISRSDRTGGTLAQYTQQLRIVNRVFIDSSVSEEPVLANLLKALRAWYCAQVLATLQLNQLVTGKVSVQDLLGVVQTGDNAHYQNAGVSAFRRMAGLTSLVEDYSQLSPAGMSKEVLDLGQIYGGGSGTSTSPNNPQPQVSPAAKTLYTAFVKGVAQAAQKKTTNVNSQKAQAAGASIFTAGTSGPNGAQTASDFWRLASYNLGTGTSSFLGEIAKTGVKMAATELGKYAIGRYVENRANKIDPENLDKLKKDLETATTKEELLGVADKYNLSRMDVQKKLDELYAPLNIDAQHVQLEKLNGIAYGDVFNVQMRDPNHPMASVSVPIMVQMTPINVPYRVAPRFIDGLVSPSIWQRWTMMTAGEIEFFRDFIGQRDRLKQRISQNDTESLRALKTFLDGIRRKDAYSLADVASKRESSLSQNLANSVMVFSADTVHQAYTESGIDLHNDADRKRYFQSTYTMIIAIVDPAFADVVVYINGIDGKISFKYSALKPADSKFNPVDLVAAIQALGDGKTPTLR